eukprot:6044715-Alexandrium_andersonii.AAC.1
MATPVCHVAHKSHVNASACTHARSMLMYARCNSAARATCCHAHRRAHVNEMCRRGALSAWAMLAPRAAAAKASRADVMAAPAFPPLLMDWNDLDLEIAQGMISVHGAEDRQFHHPAL